MKKPCGNFVKAFIFVNLNFHTEWFACIYFGRSTSFSLELVRFQNSSVSVLNFKQDSVSVLIGSSKCLTFGFTVLTVFTFFTWVPKNYVNFWNLIVINLFLMMLTSLFLYWMRLWHHEFMFEYLILYNLGHF